MPDHPFFDIPKELDLFQPHGDHTRHLVNDQNRATCASIVSIKIPEVLLITLMAMFYRLRRWEDTYNRWLG